MSINSSIFRQYETVILIRPDAADSVRTTVRERVEGIIGEAGGRMARWETWGRRRLAYEIKKQNKAYYLYANFVGAQTCVHEIERNLRIMEPVLKYQTVRLEDEVALDSFDFDKVGAERTALYLSAEEAATIERNYQREQDWAAGASRQDEEGGDAAAAPSAKDASTEKAKAAPAEEAAPAAEAKAAETDTPEAASDDAASTEE